MTTAAQSRRAQAIVRQPRDALLVVAGTAVLLLAALPVHPHSISDAETAVFSALNSTTVLPFVVVWPVMQLGNFVVVPCAALLAAAFRRWRLAGGLLLAGAGVYLLAKQVKGIWPRGRPAGLVDDVVIRGTAALGRGFVSGHAAVVTALVVVAWPWLNRPGRVVCAVLVVTVCLARVYVGAHLPLDVVGGAALGVAVAGLVRLVVGHPR
jgi:membrane-associated phospholipid phosphatase